MSRTVFGLLSGLLLTGAAFASEEPGDAPVDADPTEEAPVEEAPSEPAPSDYDNKGEFVREKLDEGLRGKDLADAVHEEWEGRKGTKDDEKTTKKNERRTAKAAAKATAKHQGKPERQPRH